MHRVQREVEGERRVDRFVPDQPVLEVQLEPASDEGEPKKRKRTRRKKGEEEGAVEAAPAAEKPSRSRRKKEEPAPSTSNDDLDALLESQPHPRD